MRVPRRIISEQRCYLSLRAHDRYLTATAVEESILLRRWIQVMLQLRSRGV
jgi:hypothetical protein